MERKSLNSVVKYDMNLWSFKIEVSILLFVGFVEGFLKVMFIYTVTWSDIMMFPIEQEATDSTSCFWAKSNQFLCNNCED